MRFDKRPAAGCTRSLRFSFSFVSSKFTDGKFFFNATVTMTKEILNAAAACRIARLRVIDEPVETVFRAWTEPQSFEKVAELQDEGSF